MGKYGESFSIEEVLNATQSPHLTIGTADTNSKTGKSAGTILIPYSSRSAHMHAIGLTQSGKSRFLADLIRQDITNGFGVTVIDPHAALVNLTVDWLMQNESVMELTPHAHVVRLGDVGTTFKFNPLAADNIDEAYTASLNVSTAITRMFGGSHPAETPRFWFVVDVICTMLALRGLPLAVAKYMFFDDAESRELRERICEGVHNPYFRKMGQELSRLKGKEFREKVESTVHRLHQIMRSPVFERMFSTTENTVDFRQMMDENHVLLVDASDESKAISFEEARLISMFFVNNIFAASRGRETYEKPTPHFLYIDECQNYLSDDIEDILSQAAKRGLFLTLSHQHLGQLVNAGPVIFDSVMAGARIKAVFQIGTKDAEILADELFAKDVDFERVKQRLKSPHVVDNTLIKLKGKSIGKTASVSGAHTVIDMHSETDADSWGDSSSRSDGLGENKQLARSFFSPTTIGVNPSGETLIEGFGSNAVHLEAYASMRGASHTSANSSGTADATGWSEQETRGESENEALMSIYEWFSITAHSLEEERYRLRRQLSHQTDRHGYLAVRREGTVGFATHSVEDPLNLPEIKHAFLEEIRSRSPWLIPSKNVPLALEHPKVKEILGAPRLKNEPLPEPENFFEPDSEPPKKQD